MKKFVKPILLFALAIIMAVSSMAIVAAEESALTSDEDTEIVVIDDGDGTRAYELVWKFKESQGHLWKRRWNATLGEWYDPAWILVY